MFPHCLDEDRCPACEAPEARGLCDWHRAGVLPQLAVPWWVWLIGVTIVSHRQPAPRASDAPLSVSPEALAHAERRRRSRRPRKSRAVVRARRRGVVGLARALTQTAPG